MIEVFFRITLTDMKPNIDQGRIEDLSRGYRVSDTMDLRSSHNFL